MSAAENIRRAATLLEQQLYMTHTDMCSGRRIGFCNCGYDEHVQAMIESAGDLEDVLTPFDDLLYMVERLETFVEDDTVHASPYCVDGMCFCGLDSIRADVDNLLFFMKGMGYGQSE